MSKLYVVATPIGNLKDITLRALEVLKAVSVIYAEDTRVTKKLLDTYKIMTPLRSYREMMPREQLDGVQAGIINQLNEGYDLALCTDAGTPGVSDPGDYLVSKVRAAGHEIVPIPGVSALATLLSVAGLAVQHPLFEGFLPHKKGRQTRLIQLGQALQSGAADGIVFYESPERTLRLLDELLEWNQSLTVCVGRELTKHFEEILVGSLSEVREKLAERTSIKGEITLLVTHAV